MPCVHPAGRSRYVSVEKAHNSVHGIVSGIMASFQSSFHPVFWMHHNNVERFFTAYLAANPDSHQEFYDHQARRAPDGARGFPEGPYGPYLPFINHVGPRRGRSNPPALAFPRQPKHDTCPAQAPVSGSLPIH